MNKKIVFPILCFSLILGSAIYSINLEAVHAASFAGGKTLVLYDAASGTTPSMPLMGFIDFPPGEALLTYTDGLTVLDTTSSGRDTYAGWISNGTATPGFPILDRTAGFQVNFTMQLEDESHINNNRAGFSIITLSEDAKGIELAFWQNEIWAQSDSSTGGLFTHGEGIAFATTSGLTDYQLKIVDDTYTLTANAELILSGPLRDYSEFDGLPDPYQTPNLIFLGDDTTSAQARIRLGFVSVTGSEPVMPTGTVTNTGSPVPAASSTPQPGITPIASPTPTMKSFWFCPLD